MDGHDASGDADPGHARRHRGTNADREVDIAGTRYSAASQDRLSDLGALLRRQVHAATRLALLSLTLLGLALLAGLTLLTLLALRLRLLVLLPLALARGLALLSSLRLALLLALLGLLRLPLPVLPGLGL